MGRVRNHLPIVGPFGGEHNISTHLHGSESAPQYDGYAADITRVGYYKDYHYPNSQVARALWYYDHGQHWTAQNVYSGLAAHYHLHDDVERDLLPQGEFDVPITVSDAIFNADGSLGYNDTDIEVETDGDLRVAGDRDALAQALTNLLANCERHAPGSPVRIWARRRDLDVVVDVRDEGPGIPRGTEKRVLERGVTVGAAGGTGLGLDVSARLLDEQGGSLRILPRRGDQGGFSARLALPTPDRATSGMLGRDHPTS